MKFITTLFAGLKSLTGKGLANLFDVVNLHHKKIGLAVSMLVVALSVLTGWYSGDNVRQWVHTKYKERVVAAAVSEFLDCMSEDRRMVIVGYQGFSTDELLLVATFIAPKWPDGMSLDEYKVHFFDELTTSNDRLFTCLNEYSWQTVSITFVDIAMVQTIDDKEMHAISEFRVRLIIGSKALKSIVPNDEQSTPEQIDTLIYSGDIDILQSSPFFPITVPAEMFNGDVDRAIEIYVENN